MPPETLTPPDPQSEDVYCLTCRYNLRGLAGPTIRCPECGQTNDLSFQQLPDHLYQRARRGVLLELHISAIGIVVVPGVLLTFVIAPFSPCCFAIVLAVSVAAAVRTASSLRTLARECTDCPHWRRPVLYYRLTWGVATAFVLATVLSSAALFFTRLSEGRLHRFTGELQLLGVLGTIAFLIIWFGLNRIDRWLLRRTGVEPVVDHIARHRARHVFITRLREKSRR